MCSSDLIGVATIALDYNNCEHCDNSDHSIPQTAGLWTVDSDESLVSGLNSLDKTPMFEMPQIGRASCRERV